MLGAHAEKIRPVLARLPVLIADSPAWAEGMAASIRAGVTTLRQFSRALDGALVRTGIMIGQDDATLLPRLPKRADRPWLSLAELRW